MWSDDPKVHEECVEAIRRVAVLHGPDRHVAALREIVAGSAYGRSSEWMATMADVALYPQFCRQQIIREAQITDTAAPARP